MITLIATREFRSLFSSPLAWLTLAITQFIFAYLFLSRIDLFLQYQPRLRSIDNAPGMTEIILNGLFSNAAILLIVLVPLFTARCFAEERRNGSFALTLSSPVSLLDVVLGKFVGLAGFFCIVLSLLLLLTFALTFGGAIDIGQVFSGFLGLILLTFSAIALGLFISSMSSQSTIAAILTIMLLSFLWIIQWENAPVSLVTYLSMEEHFSSLNSGVLASVDVIYFILLTVLFIGLTLWRLDWERNA